MVTTALSTAVNLIKAPLLYKGKVRELYDLGENVLIVVTDRISAFDYILSPAVPDKGNMLNQISRFWFGLTKDLQENHVVHADVNLLEGIVTQPELLKDRVMVVKKAQRIDIECIVRGYITGGGWRQYQQTGEINGQRLPEGLRKNQPLPEPIFTPSAKNDVGHDEDISIERMKELVGGGLTDELERRSKALYDVAHQYCKERGIILADTKFEFGILDGKVILIDEVFTPDSSRFWAVENYGLDIEIDSMDKEPVRTYLSGSGWDKNSEPDPLPQHVVDATAQRYRDIYRKLAADA